MKTCLIGALVGLAISFALPTFAQQSAATSTPVPIITPETSSSPFGPVDPKVRQQIEALDAKYDEAFNKHDAAAIAALFTEDAIQIIPGNEIFSGREAIEKRYQALFAGSPFSNHRNKLDQMGTGFGIWSWAIGSWTVESGAHTFPGFRILVYMPEGGEWKISKELVYF
jgi:ketosteroid isomerase-like protein